MSKGPGRPPTAKSLKEYFSRGEARKRWDEAKELAKSGTAFGEYDDGKYRVQVVSAEVNNSQSKGTLQHVITFKFLEGEYKGKTVSQYQGVENDVGLSILIGTLAKLGYDVESPEEIENTVDRKLTKAKPICMLRLKTKGEYQNKIVLGLEEGQESAINDDEDSEESDDESDTTKGTEPDDAEDRDEKPPKSSKKPVVESDDDEEDEDEVEEEDDEDDDEDEEEEKPSKKAKADEPEEDEEDDEDSEESEPEEEKEQVELIPGLKVKVRNGKEVVKGKIVKVLEDESKIKVKLANGEKILVKVPNDVIDILE